MTTHINDMHRAAFEALTSGRYGNFALFSCFVNGEEGVAIVSVNEDGPGYAITPLYVSVTAGMDLVDHDGNRPGAAGQP